MNKDLLRIAITYIEKGYSCDDMIWEDDLYDASEEDVDECISYYEDVQKEGTKWAYKQLEDE